MLLPVSVGNGHLKLAEVHAGGIYFQPIFNRCQRDLNSFSVSIVIFSSIGLNSVLLICVTFISYSPHNR